MTFYDMIESNSYFSSVVHTGNREFSCPHCTQRFLPQFIRFGRKKSFVFKVWSQRPHDPTREEDAR